MNLDEQCGAVKCPECQFPIADEYSYCPRCGTLLKRNCANCGHELKANWRVCPYCGMSIEEAESKTAPKMPLPEELTTPERVVEELLDVIMSTVIHIINADSGSLLLWDDDEQALRIRRAHGLQESVVRGARVRPGEGIAGRVFAQGTPLLLPPPRPDPELESLMRRGTRVSSMCVPLKGRMRTLGVLTVNSTTEGKIFTEADLEVVTALATRAAVALEEAMVQNATYSQWEHFTGELAKWSERRCRLREGQAMQVASWVEKLCFRLGLPVGEIPRIKLAALLCDVGMLVVPEALLNKEAPLTDEERETLQQHPMVSAMLVRLFPLCREQATAIMSHHEHWDGSGYPEGLSGEDIPLVARILAVADAYVAMTSPRPHRDAMEPADAAQQLLSNAGKQFDPRIVREFCQLLEDEGIIKLEIHIETEGTYAQE